MTRGRCRDMDSGDASMKSDLALGGHELWHGIMASWHGVDLKFP